jgi:penicillin-binding protein 1C
VRPLVWAVVAGLALTACGKAPDLNAPNLDAIRHAHPPSSAWLLDRNGALLQEVRVEFRYRQAAWQPLDTISPALRAEVVRHEDRRFETHGGVDLRALLHAAWQNLRGERRRGASTLTMQLAGFLDPALASGAHKTAWGKFRQMLATWKLERRLSKAQILEAYLNLAPFRGELRGVPAAAAALFGKRADALSDDEAVLLAALLPAPQADAARAAARACRYAAADGARCGRLKRLAEAAFAGAYAQTGMADDAPHLAVQFDLKPGEIVRTTLDAALQRRVQGTLDAQLAQLHDGDVEDGAVLVLDNASGEALAYVGSRRASRQRHVDGVRAPRQAGSTLKPFLYALALEQRILTAASVLDDSPVALATPSGQYVPQNYDRHFRGRVNVRTALAGSLNVPAVRTLLLAGLEPFHARLAQLGLPLAHAADHYGFALALGASEVDLWSLTNAYRALANGGLASPARLAPAPTRPEVQAFDPAAAFVVSDILADRAARSVTFGLENPLATPFWSAVKTGTSKDMRDNWCVGFSRRHTVGVWVGNFDGRPMRGVSGVTGAAPAWLDTMLLLDQGERAAAPTPPSGVERRAGEWFLAGSAPARGGTVAPAPRIAYPGDGAILALDPDMPPAMQRVFLAATGGTDAVFVLDGVRLGPARGNPAWTPTPGRHELHLVDARDGRVLDRAAFQVRGVLLPQ